MDRTSEQAEERLVVSRLDQPVWYWSLAFLVAGFYVATSLYISSHRLLWSDEIYTAITTRMPNFRTIWESLSASSDQIPPLYFLITRGFDRLFRHADIGLRVPSALALGAGLLVTFDIARRLTDGVYGLLAMAFLTTSFVPYYGYEARPYALCFTLVAVALWLWIFTKDESKTAAAAFGALFLIGVAIHYYFLLCLAPFGIAALLGKRIFHPKLIAAAAGVMCSMAVLHRQIASSHSAAILADWAAPSPGRLPAVYLEFFPGALLPLVLTAAGVVVFGRPRERLVSSMTSGERISWLFLTIPLAEYLLAVLVTNRFLGRYIIGAVPGIAVAVTCLLWRYCRESRYLSLALLVVFGWFGVTQQLLTLKYIDHIEAVGDYQEGTRQILALEDTLHREGKSHFAVTSNLQFLEVWYYSKYSYQYGYAGPRQSWVTRKYLALDKRYPPLNILSIKDIVANARQTAVINPGPDLIAALEGAGLHTKVRFSEPQYVVYLE